MRSNMVGVIVAEKRGELWPADQTGRVMNAGCRKAMTPLARRVARAIAESYRTHMGGALHSVYLTGPAARGRPGPIEAFGVLRKTATPLSTDWLEDTTAAINARWPAAGVPELTQLNWEELFPADGSFSEPAFRIGVTSVCLAGKDLSGAVQPQRLSVSAANAWIIRTRDHLEQLADEVTQARDEHEVRHAARRAGRYLLSAGFALVLVNEAVYTEDPDLQRDFIVLNEPERAPEADTAFDLIVEPTSSAVELMALLHTFGGWIAAKSEAWLDQHNPQRLGALPA